ncbi:helix-turn-helix domain-containing protein [Kitasatospora sp. KL5]|uniref:helix-turn-helix domain-containing protein n=1 Tax=Kitasatospora sp. KL5 TaxID=3425125 RepID=UPI003D6DCD70
MLFSFKSLVVLEGSAGGRLTFSGDTRYRDETPGTGGTRTPLPWTQPAAERARIILACADGMSNAAVAGHVGVQAKTVGKWRRKFAAEGLAGLQDAGRTGRPKADLVLSRVWRRTVRDHQGAVEAAVVTVRTTVLHPRPLESVGGRQESYQGEPGSRHGLLGTVSGTPSWAIDWADSSSGGAGTAALPWRQSRSATKTPGPVSPQSCSGVNPRSCSSIDHYRNGLPRDE